MLSRAPNEDRLTRRSYSRQIEVEVSNQLGIPAAVLGFDVLQHYKCAFSVGRKELYLVRDTSEMIVTLQDDVRDVVKIERVICDQNRYQRRRGQKRTNKSLLQS